MHSNASCTALSQFWGSLSPSDAPNMSVSALVGLMLQLTDVHLSLSSLTLRGLFVWCTITSSGGTGGGGSVNDPGTSSLSAKVC